MIDVVIVDDHSVVREGLKQIIAQDPLLHLKGEASNAAEAVELLSGISCQVVVLDVSLPGRSGLETLEDIRPHHPGGVLFFSMHAEPEYVWRALRAGAAGYITKDASPQQVSEAIRAVAAGRRYVSPTLAGQLVEVFGSEEPPHMRLSARELHVLELLAAGSRPLDIATRLGLSPKTVSTYRARILAKLALSTTGELIRYAVEHNLVE